VRPTLFTFDVFGTVIDWQRGLRESVAALDHQLTDDEFSRVIDVQARDEQAGYRLYRNIAARSLVEVLGIDAFQAATIGAELGHWPPFADSAEALKRLSAIAPLCALTNSDRVHGNHVQAALGVELSNWICAEELRAYKPAEAFWQTASQRLGVAFGKSWWHVSAYSDYDLEPARSLGLTTVLVRRPHHRAGAADVTVSDLTELATLAAAS
jgi:2-haloalkanoic acid dehalogenase type II